MPKALGKVVANLKPLLTAVAAIATAVGWVAGSAFDPPRATLGAMTAGAVGIAYFSLRPRLRPRHPHSSLPLPLFPVLVLA